MGPGPGGGIAGAEIWRFDAKGAEETRRFAKEGRPHAKVRERVTRRVQTCAKEDGDLQRKSARHKGHALWFSEELSAFYQRPQVRLM